MGLMRFLTTLVLWSIPPLVGPQGQQEEIRDPSPGKTAIEQLLLIADWHRDQLVKSLPAENGHQFLFRTYDTYFPYDFPAVTYFDLASVQPQAESGLSFLKVTLVFQDLRWCGLPAFLMVEQIPAKQNVYVGAARQQKVLANLARVKDLTKHPGEYLSLAKQRVVESEERVKTAADLLISEIEFHPFGDVPVIKVRFDQISSIRGDLRMTFTRSFHLDGTPLEPKLPDSVMGPGFSALFTSDREGPEHFLSPLRGLLAFGCNLAICVTRSRETAKEEKNQKRKRGQLSPIIRMTSGYDPGSPGT